MELIFKNNGAVEINDARIIWPNFSGAPDQFNPQGGKRTFHLVIPNDEIAQALLDAGWNVKIKAPRTPDEEPFRHMKVSVGYNGYRPPSIWLMAGSNRVKITEETVDQLDRIDIDHVDLDINPYHSNGHQAAYVESMVVVQRLSRFEARWADEEFPEE